MSLFSFSMKRAGCASAMMFALMMAPCVAASAKSLKPDAAYAQYPRYEGTLGARHITLLLGKPERPSGDNDDPNARQGEYRFDDTGEVRQIAGVRDGNILEAEDTADGENIAGNWTGLFDADGRLQGARTNADGAGSQPFDLRVVAAGAPAPAPVHAPAHTHPVEGVSNLHTED